MKQSLKNIKGFTIAELLIATVILGILLLSASAVYTSFFNSYRSLRAANLVYEEARFTMEKIVKEARSGTIDYEEYYNQAKNPTTSEANETYGKNYCEYSKEFYDAGKDGQKYTFDDISLGKNGGTKPIENPLQDQLFLINADGNRRTYLKLIKKEDKNKKIIGKVGILKLKGKDWGSDHVKSDGTTCKKDAGEGDGLIDTWLCESGYKCTYTTSGCNATYKIADDPNSYKSSFVDITPSTLDIVDLKFFITPKDDPHKAYADSTSQIQPHVTIKLIARANPKLLNKFQGGIPNIILESTVTSRVYTEIITKCDTQECKQNAGPKKCSKQGELVNGSADGSVSGATVTCAQGVYPVCTNDTYKAAAKAFVLAEYEANIVRSKQANASDGLDHKGPFTESGYTFYESDSETGSCDTFSKSKDDQDACRERRCSDEYDNDGNGKADKDDPVCLSQLCKNGIQDADEICVDVGGRCSALRPRKAKETGNDCFDGYDNDCDDYADEFDKNCIDYICSNGFQDPITPNKFINPNYDYKQYLVLDDVTKYTKDLNEQCIDIGGICDGASSGKQGQEDDGETLCFDGLDNDCDGKADELDDDCKTIICSNKKKDCGLAPKNYETKDYLKGYNDSGCVKESKLDETGIDCGGICSEGISSSIEICNDAGGLDNDCDTKSDYNDDYCIDKAGLFFFDTFTSWDYLNKEATNVRRDNGDFILDNKSSGSIISKTVPLNKETCKRVTSASIKHSAFTTSGADIKYLISNGGTWHDITMQDIIENKKVSFSSDRNDLKWKAILTRNIDNPASKATIKDITISFTCE